jgi:hypothetical protein
MPGHGYEVTRSHLGQYHPGRKDERRDSSPARQEAAREVDRAEAYAWSVRMEGYGGPARSSPTIGQCIHGGLGWLEVECNRCKTRASLPLDAIRRPRDTPIWKLEAALKCLSCRKGRDAPPMHMITLTETREITPMWEVRRRRCDSQLCSSSGDFFKETQPKELLIVLVALGGGSNRRLIHVRSQLTCGRDAPR